MFIDEHVHFSKRGTRPENEKKKKKKKKKDTQRETRGEVHFGVYPEIDRNLQNIQNASE